jgi:hypothetical protein
MLSPLRGALGPLGMTGGLPPLAAPVPVLGGEFIVNRTFNDASWWTVQPDWTVGAGVITHTAPATNGAFYRSGLLPKQWYQIAYDYAGVTAGKIIFDSFAFASAKPAVSGSGAVLDTDFCSSANASLVFRSQSGFDGAVDNPSVRPLILSSLISTRAYQLADCDISTAITLSDRTQAGLAARVDDPSLPQNFLFAHLDGVGNIRLNKYVAGTITFNLIIGAIVYAAGRVMRLVCAGNSVSCYYNGTQVGSTVTVADAGIVNNKNHGLFSTYAGNTFANYTAV